MKGYRKKFERKPKTNVTVEAYQDSRFSSPVKEKISSGSATLEAKAFRDLNNIRVIDVKADPNTEMSFGAFPYTIIGQTGQVVDAKYPGYDNISGNSIVEIQNNTNTSQLMNIFDIAAITKTINYNYLPIRDDAKNVALAGEFIKSIEQAVSFGFSTMLTQLAFTTDSYVTDIPVPSEYITEDEGETIYAPSAQWYGALVHYQTVLQNAVMPIAKYIEMRSLEKEMMRMSFRTEAPMVTEIMGLFKKASFISVVNTIGTVAINEYFDVNWYKQINTLLCVPSRKTKGMVDPLLTLIGTHNIPALKIYKKDDLVNPVYDYTEMGCGSAAVLLDPEDYNFKQGAQSFRQLIENCCKLMNPAYILRFVRKLNAGTILPTGDYEVANTTNAYVEGIIAYLKYISKNAAYFSTRMSDVRTFLDKMSNSGMVYWTKGTAFFVDKIEQLEPKYNALLNDVFQATYAGSDTITFDAATKRWRAFTLWNKYTGIPEYDRRSGGSFLTFGLRNISGTDSAGGTVDFESSAGLIPVLFGSTTGNIIVTRTGRTYSIVSESITNTTLNTDPYLVRLNPINMGNVSLKQPTITVDTADDAKRARIVSSLLLFLGNAFGFGKVKYSTTNYRTLDPDYVAFLDLEIEDVSNQMIVFARNYAPFRVSTPDGSRTMGFSA